MTGLNLTLAEFVNADPEVVSISRAVMLFLIVCVGLLALFIGLLLITRLRKRLRSIPETPKESTLPDPWKESANRVEVDPDEPSAGDDSE